jgi:hypothetical protein
VSRLSTAYIPPLARSRTTEGQRPPWRAQGILARLRWAAALTLLYGTEARAQEAPETPAPASSPSGAATIPPTGVATIPPPPRQARPTAEERLPFDGPRSIRVRLQPHETIEAGTCRLPGAFHSGDTVVSLAPDDAPGVTSDDEAGCDLGSYVRWQAGSEPTAVQLSVRCFGIHSGCSGTLAWRVRGRPVVSPVREGVPLRVPITLVHGMSQRVVSRDQRGILELTLLDESGRELSRRTTRHAGAVEFSEPFADTMDPTLLVRCVGAGCAASLRIESFPDRSHDEVRWEASTRARLVLGSASRGIAFGASGDLSLLGRVGPLAVRFETPSISAVMTDQGGILTGGVRGLVGLTHRSLELSLGGGMITLNHRLGGVRDAVVPEGVALLRVGGTAFWTELAVGMILGARATPTVSLARLHLWGRVARTLDFGTTGIFSQHGEIRVEASARVWLRGYGVAPGSVGLSGSFGAGAHAYQPLCPLGPCSEILLSVGAVAGVGLTWRP